MDVSAEFPAHALREYALLGDGERGAMIGPRGDLCWMCAPRWDSDAVFSTLIGSAGCYGVNPGRAVHVGRVLRAAVIDLDHSRSSRIARTPGLPTRDPSLRNGRAEQVMGPRIADVTSLGSARSSVLGHRDAL